MNKKVFFWVFLVLGTIAYGDYQYGGISATLVPFLNNSNTWTVGGQQINIATTNSTGLVIREIASQTSNIQEWQSPTGSVLSYIDSNGKYRGDGSLLTGVTPSFTVGTIDTQTASTDGLVISGTGLYAQSASASKPGLVNTTTQTMAGAKTFTGITTIGSSNIPTDGNFKVGDNGIIEVAGVANAGLYIGATPQMMIGYTSTGYEIQSWGGAGLYLNRQGNNIDFGSGDLILDNSNARVGLSVASPSATLHIKAGTTSASTAPIKINPGSVMTSTENGAIESDGTHLYWTDSGGTRHQLDN